MQILRKIYRFLSVSALTTSFFSLSNLQNQALETSNNPIELQLFALLSQFISLLSKG